MSKTIIVKIIKVINHTFLRKVFNRFGRNTQCFGYFLQFIIFNSFTIFNVRNSLLAYANRYCKCFLFHFA